MKRMVERGARKTRPPIPARKPAIIGDDFWRVFGDAKQQLAKALEPGKAGRPRKSFEATPNDERRGP